MVKVKISTQGCQQPSRHKICINASAIASFHLVALKFLSHGITLAFSFLNFQKNECIQQSNEGLRWGKCSKRNLLIFFLAEKCWDILIENVELAGEQ